MSFLQFASEMWPYWMLGLCMFYAVSKSSYRKLLKVNKKSIVKWSMFVLALSVWRYFTLSLAVKHGTDLNGLVPAKQLPLAATFFVGWEDMCHSLPLVILGRMCGDGFISKMFKFLSFITIMFAFMLGHLYEGLFSAALIALYIPFGMYFGKKNGFGTLAICHIIYDLLTLLTIKLI